MYLLRTCLLFCCLLPILVLGQIPYSASKVFGLTLNDLKGNQVKLTQMQTRPLAAIFFLSPECPLCENYSLTINQLRGKFPTESVAFYGIFSGEHFSDSIIQTYLDRYQPAVTPLLDPKYEVQHLLGAEVTPEVFLLNELGEILYSGSIDNWIPALGKKRPKVTRHYLQAAIRAAEAGQPISVSHTQAIGCFIE